MIMVAPFITTFSLKPDPLARAFNRATSERVVVYRRDAGRLGVATVVGGVWTDKPYCIRVIGPQPEDVTCDCPAGSYGRACKHLAVASFAREYHVYARRPASNPELLRSLAFSRCPVCGMERADPMHDVFCQG
jgi:hypothetical protein